MDHLEVDHFLKEMKGKLIVGQIIYAYRDAKGKNQDTLLELNIVPNQRDAYIKSLEYSDFCTFHIDEFGGNALMVFGKKIRNKEVYIKIQLKALNVLCISFHIADHEMNYKFK